MPLGDHFQLNIRNKENSVLQDGSFDKPFLLLTIILLIIGVIMVLSASFARAYYDPENQTGGNATYYFVKQCLFAVCGIAMMMIISRISLSFIRRISLLFFAVSIIFLALVLIPGIGAEANGSRRWIDLGFTTFQPSEIVKLTTILFFADFICKKKNEMRKIKNLIPLFGGLAIVVILLVFEPHFSAAVILGILFIVLLFVGGAPLYWFLIGGGALFGILYLAYNRIAYIHERIVAWINPFSDLTDNGWQIVQSLYAIGSGGLLGLGLGNSRQKYLYLPEEHNDYIFSIVCEELGFIGAVLIMILFALFIARGIWISIHAKTRFSFLVGIGIVSLFTIQIVLNIAVCTNTLPCTGISLPFFSYGGTALLLQLSEVGVLLSISRTISEG